MAGIILDTVAIADGAHHFDVEMRALDHALSLNDFPLAFELTLPPVELFVNALNCALLLIGRQNVVALGINQNAIDFVFSRTRTNFAGERIELSDSGDFATPELDAHGEIVVRRINLDHIAAYAKGAALEVFGALVLNFDKLAQDGFARDGLTLFDELHHSVIGLRGAEAVNTRDGSHDDDVATFEERTRGAHAQLVELIVDGGLFFDVGVARRDVGFRLVVIVIADKILDGVIGKERAKFVEKLGGQSFIVRQDDGGAIDFLDPLRHGECFAGAGDAENDLLAFSVFYSAEELGDGFGLVAARLVVTS